MIKNMNEIYWNAVKTKDKRFDGIFFTCVKTTKIFCRPICTARLPKRENVSFCNDWQTAENTGFRACLRCKPKSETFVNPQIEKIVKACEILETEDEVTLEIIGERLKLNPNHLQKVFKEIIGVSPKKYAENLRIERFKSEIKSGNDVVSSIYEAGYGSSRSLYENVSSKLGMTPKVYQKGGKGMKINFTVADCYLGKMQVARTEKGVCSVTFGDSDEFLIEKLREEFPNAEITENLTDLKAFVEEILEHLSGKNKLIELPMDLQATAFQMQVWELLRKIPFGETLSYKQVAEKLGNPKAVRAVARACATNRIAVVIPCHRVIGTNGSLSGYRWGIERKQKLIDSEKSRQSDGEKNEL
jgi:AraC family transcriptional regulator, regulatory protein of adaptative response / methylated-DNA-[protein]-cysteine methyltransferase